MIRVNVRDTIFNDLLAAMSAYERYSKLTPGTSFTNQVIISDPSGIPIIPYYDIDAIKSSDSNIVIIDMITEGYHINRYFADYPKNKKYILFSNGWWDSTIDIGIDYVLIYWTYFLFDYIKRLTCPNILDYFQDLQYDYTQDKDFVFSALIGKQHITRDKLVNLIKSTVQFNNYILNYQGQELGQPNHHLDINYNFEKWDSHSEIDDHYSISSSIPIKIYNKTQVLLVVETDCFDIDEFHLTEKTIKALITGIPFILIGSYNFIKHLHRLGFKTYNEIWSEEYDNISNVDDRLSAIVDLLNQLPFLKWDEQLVDKLKEIAYYNKSQLLNANSIMKTQIETIVNDFNDFNDFKGFTMDHELLEKIYNEVMNIRLDMVQVQYEMQQLRKDIKDMQTASEEPIGIIPNTPRPDIF